MRWKGRERSQNVEDRRGMKPKVAAGGGLVVLVIAGIAILLGANPNQIQQLLNQAQQQNQQVPAGGGAGHDDEVREFLSVVLRDTENVWSKLFRENVGSPYRQPTLVVFSQLVDTGCGRASSQVGPFYCPAAKGLHRPDIFL